MSRVEEFADLLNRANKKSGMGQSEWNLQLLSDIALSLARIVDALEKDGDSDDTPD